VKQLASGGIAYRGGLSRIQGSFLHPNPFAIYLTFLIVFAAGLLPHLRGRTRAAMLVFLISATPVLLFTYSRSSWIAAGVGLLVVGMLQSKRLILGLAMVGVVVVLAVPSVSARFSDLERGTRPSGATGNSLEWRFQYWGQALQLARNPIFGIGLREVQASTEDQADAHNDFVRVYVETGLIGLGAYLWFIVELIRSARRSIRRTAAGLTRGIAVGFAAVVVSFLLLSLVSNIISQLVVLWYFCAIAGAALAAARLSSRRELVPA
jgi:putative inorganic carbon (HCO3(-)) transporter